MTRIHIPSHKMMALLARDCDEQNWSETAHNIVAFEPSPPTLQTLPKFKKYPAKIIPFNSFKASKP